MSLLMLTGEALKAIGKVRQALFLHGISTPLLLLLLALWLVSRHGVEGIAWAFVVSNAGTAFLGWVIWHSVMHDESVDPSLESWQAMLHSLAPLFWVSIMSLVIEWTGTLMLGALSTSEEVGVYGIVLKLVPLINLTVVVVNNSLAPRFAALYSNDDLDTIQQLARRVTRIATAFSLPVFLCFMFFPTYVLGLFGETFAGGAASLMILSAAKFINVTTGSVGYFLMMSGSERIFRNIMVISAGGNIVLSAVLIPYLGMAGAAIATGMSLIFNNLAALIVIRRRFGIRVSV
jgi:O-antigen/teichoic acid export membrane protein